MSYSDPYYYFPDNNESNVLTYGLLYNWAAVMKNEGSSDTDPSGVQGVCPEGWHLPSRAEWNQLSNYVSLQPAYYCNENSDYIAKAFASTSGWLEDDGLCAVGNNLSANNATGLTILPAGYLYDYGLHLYFGYFAALWSATERSGTDGYCSSLQLSDSGLNEYYPGAGNNIHIISKEYGFSVRCVRNE